MTQQATAQHCAHPLWRSLLYVPGNRPRFIDTAHTRGADAVILDLEDSVPPRERDAARAALPRAIASVGQSGADVLVRVNADGGVLEEDLQALEHCLPRAIVLPKVENAAEVRRASGWLSGRPHASGVGLYVLIETARGLANVHDIAASDPRVLAMTLGGEDFAADLGMEATPETLDLPRQMVLYATRAAGLLPLGLMGSIARYQDLVEVEAVAARSRRFGFEGAACIHPSVVPVLNRAFSPSAEDVAHARRIVEAYEASVGRGLGSIAVDGQMVDVPVAERARRLLERHRRIREREGG